MTSQQNQNHFTGLTNRVSNAPESQRDQILLQGIWQEFSSAKNMDQVQQLCQELQQSQTTLISALGGKSQA